MSVLTWKNGYGEEYDAHVRATNMRGDNLVSPLVDMIKGWERYRDIYEERYGMSIGEDSVIGFYWAEMGLFLIRMMEGDTNGLNCNIVSINIVAAIRNAGFKTDGHSIDLEV